MPKFSLKEARTSYASGDYGNSMFNYLGLVKLLPLKRQELENEFINTLESCSKHADLQQTLEFCDLTAELYPHSSRFHNIWGQILFRQGRWDESLVCFVKAMSLEPQNGRIERNLCNLRTHLVDQWHFRMINDTQRNIKYKNAIEFHLKDLNPSDNFSVLDIGAGTCILSMLAQQINQSAKITACEQWPAMCEIANRVLEQNKMEQINLIQSMSTDIKIGQGQKCMEKKADLIVTELMDAGFFGENIIGTLLDAKERLLSDDGFIIPSKAKIYAVLVESETIRRQNVAAPEDFCGLIKCKDYFASELCSGENLTEPYTCEFLYDMPGNHKFLSEPIEIDEVDFNSLENLRKHKDGLKSEICMKLETGGNIDAIVCWFEVELSPKMAISSHPDQRNSWEQAIFPQFLPHKSFSQGETVAIDVEIKCDWFRCRVKKEEQYNFPVKFVPQESISCLNNSILSNSYRFMLQSASNLHISTIIDLSANPLLSCLAAKITGAKIISCNSNQSITASLLAANDLQDRVRLVQGDVTESLHSDWSSGASVHSVPSLLCNPVHSHGLLLSSVLQDVAYCRAKYNIATVFPSSIQIWAQIVSSEQLLNWTRVLSDQNTLGLNIKDSMNIFSTRIQQNINFSSLDQRALSGEFRVMDLNLEEPIDADCAALPGFMSQTKEAEVRIEREGSVDAVLVWHILTHNKCSITCDTRQSDTICAYMVEERPHVAKGNMLKLGFELDAGNLDVQLL